MFVPSPLMGEGQDEGGTEPQKIKLKPHKISLWGTKYSTAKAANHKLL